MSDAGDPPTQPGSASAVPERFLPPATELERLERLSPGITARLLNQWERRLEHRREIETRGLEYARQMAFTGFVVAVILGVVGAFTNHAAATLSGGVVGTVDLVALVTVFIQGRR